MGRDRGPRDELRDRRLRVTVLETAEEAAIRERRERLRKGIERVREASKGLGPFPKREITLDVLYPDEDEPL